MPNEPSSGWYADPDGLPCERFWDGESWTSRTRPQARKPGKTGLTRDSMEPTNFAGSRRRNRGRALVFSVVGLCLLIGLFVFFGTQERDKLFDTAGDLPTAGLGSQGISEDTSNFFGNDTWSSQLGRLSDGGGEMSEFEKERLRAEEEVAERSSEMKAELTQQETRRTELQLLFPCLPDCAGENLNYAELWVADLQGVNFEGASLRGAKLAGSNLKGANFSNTDLSFSFLGGADLTSTNFSNANLAYADLQDANLARANFEKANLKEANFHQANLTFATLIGADTQKTDFSESKFQATLCPSGKKVNKASSCRK
jgi:uncharacterized protein YjbI with pentapeptide repeats